MNWRWDWILLASGLISLGLTYIWRSRSELLSLLDEGTSGPRAGDALLSAYLLPICLLGGFVLRLGFRIFANRSD